MKRAPNKYKVGKEVVLDAAKLNQPQIRCLVTNYYDAQNLRKRSDMQIRHIGMRQDEIAEPLQAWGNVQAQLEKDVLKMLEAYASQHSVGKWMMSQHGVGPVTAAGLLAYLDITVPAGDCPNTPTVGHWWRLCGLDPTSKWEKGKKRPYNAQLKQICWHLGQSFLKTYSAGHLYGRLYKFKKDQILERNERGDYAERAKTFYTNSAEVRAILAKGKLPPFNLDAQARRFAVKIFLSHFHALMYWYEFKKAPPKPFAIAILGHAHEIMIPDHNMFPGFGEAYYGIRGAEASE